MSSASFGLQVVVCAALALWLWAACAGVGSLVLPARPDGTDERMPVSWHQPGVAACIGLAALVFLGGISTALHVFWWLPVGLVAVIGTVVMVQRCVDGRHRLSRAAVIVGALGATVLVAVALVESIPGLRFPLSVCDDLRAYLPMASRLVATNGLVEPWSARRLTLLGGYPYLQALPVAVYGDRGLGVLETTIAAVFTGGIFVATGFRRTWARIVAVALVVTIPFLWVPRGNTTGVLLALPLLVAVLAVGIELRVALHQGSRGAAARWAIGGGLIAAALVSVRTPLGVLAAVLLAGAALVVEDVAVRRRFEALGVAAAATVVGLVPWSIASWMDVGSPLYPVFPGNLNPSAYQAPPSTAGLPHEVWRLVHATPYPWVALAVLAVAALAYRILPDALYVVVAAVAVGLMLVVIGVQEPSLDALPYIRYVAPAAEALVVFLLYEALRAADASERGVSVGWRTLSGLVIVASLVAGAITFSGLGVTGRDMFIPSGLHFVRLASDDATGSNGEGRVQDVERPLYRAAMRAVPDASRAIVAVDRPFLVDYDRYDVPNMDVPGNVAPGGEFPFFTGPAAKVDTLRRDGIDTLVVTSPGSDACLSFTVLTHPPGSRDSYSRYFHDWGDDIAKIRKRAPDAVRQFGTLFVIDLKRAERELHT